MADGTIQTDVPEGNKGPQDNQNTNPEAIAGQEEGAAAPAGEEAKPILNDAVSRRERRMAEVADRAREEREKDRKSAALMNDPDLTEEEYDAKLNAIREGVEEQRTRDHADPDAGEAPDIAAQGEEGKPKADPRPGWEIRESDGKPVKKLKVNGQIRELTEEEYDRYLAKDLAGDEKLRQAAQREKQIEAELEKRDRKIREQHQPPTGADDEAFEKALSEYHDAVYSGDTDAAKEKLREITRAGRQSSTPNIEDLTASVARQVRDDIENERQENDVQDGWGRFQREYPEIVSDNKRLAWADANLKEVMADSPELSPAEMFLEAGRRTAEELGIKRKDPVESKSNDERLQRKRNLSSVPRTNSARAPTAPEKEKVDNSPEGKIARMRAARAVN